MVKVQTEETHKPTCNGIMKGRPGKGNVLSLEQRKRCYAGHKMTEDNTFRYRAKIAGSKKRAPVRAWCKKCRTDSRKRSAAKRLEAARVEAVAKAERNAKARDRRAAKRTAVAA